MMARVQEIQNLQQPELAVYTGLTQAQLRNRQNPENGLFIAESPKVIGHALDAGYQPVSLLLERRHIEGSAAQILARCGDIPVYTGNREVLAALTGYALTRGVLCAMRRPAPVAAASLLPNARRVAVLENVADPTNVGAVFRNAAALGVDAVLLTPSCCDPLYRRAVRVSMGTVFQVPWARLGKTPEDWPGAGMELLRQYGFHTVALALDDRAISIEEPRLAAEKRLAMILGTEGDGLAAATVAACDDTVCIPMAAGVDSLNVAAASALAFWQLRAGDAGGR